MQFQFGAGLMWGVPLTDATGATITNPTPVLFGAMQEVSIDFSFDVKELYGNLQFPLAIGRGKGKISLKAKMAQIYGLMFNSMFFGQTLANGVVSAFYDTAGAAIPTTPFTITVTPPSSGTYSNDLGVRNANGLPLTRVASGPTTGQYSVNEATGVYTFASADVGTTVYISYEYTATSTVAKKMNIVNQPLGYIPTFQCVINVPYQGKVFHTTFPNCVSTKLGFATKLDDFMIPDFEFSAFADAAGNVVTIGSSE